jgi:hypothetical protein
VRGCPPPPTLPTCAQQGAINFAVFSSSAATVHLVLFTEGDLHAGRVTVEASVDAGTARDPSLRQPLPARSPPRALQHRAARAVQLATGSKHALTLALHRTLSDTAPPACICKPLCPPALLGTAQPAPLATFAATARSNHTNVLPCPPQIPLNPLVNRTGDVWHVMIPNLRDDLLYGECRAPP